MNTDFPGAGIYKSEYDRMMYEMSHIFAGPRRTHNRTPKVEGQALAKAKGLHKWQLEDGAIIYARNIDEAVKRAKKRGLWKPGYSVKLIEL